MRTSCASFQKKDNVLIDSLFKKGGKLYEYYNIWSSEEVNCKDLTYFLRKTNIDDVYIRMMDVNSWFKYKQEQNGRCFEEQLHKETDNNAKSIYSEIKSNQGKMVAFSYKEDDCGILITVVATDEDYYWTYYNLGKNEFCFSSCVGGYNIIDENPQVPFSDEQMGKKMQERFSIPYCMDAVVYWGKYKK